MFDPCSCISYVQAKTGHVGEIWGYPNKLEPNSSIPWPGSLVLLNEGEFGHIALILSIEGSNLLIIEANYIECRVSTRVLSINAPQIRGYLR